MHVMHSPERTKLIRLPEVKNLTGMARSTIYERLKDGSFPRPLKLSIRHVAWRERDVLDWIESLPTSEGLTWEELPLEAESSSKTDTANTSK